MMHRNLTKRLLRGFHYSPTVTAIVSETATWPDWFRWNSHAPHAQTPSRPDGLPENLDQAQEDCSALLRDYLAAIRKSGMKERPVWLGFALHLVQDLSVHQGRTNDEHAWQILLGPSNPDLSFSGLRQGAEYSARLLQHIEASFPKEERDKLRAGTEVNMLTESERVTLIGPRDFSRRSLFGFVRLGVRYPFIQSADKRVRWNTEKVLTQALA